MKIGIDARMWGGGYGIGRYLEQLIYHLALIDKENEYILFVREIEEKKKKSLPNNFRFVEADIPWYSFSEQFSLPKILKKEKVDLMHFPHWNVPLFYQGPFVLTLHDLIMYHYPRQEASTHGPFLYWIKDRIHRFVLKSAATRAVHIFATSEFTKKDIHTTLGVPREKMTVTYQAPFERGKKEENDSLKISKPYILYVGAAYPHKNLEGLLRGWNIFSSQHPQYSLVLVGKENFFYKRLIDSELFKHTHNVHYTGFVEDKKLELLYQNASLFVFPSFYEGMGIPPLEALVRGVPVVSSDRTCMKEVLGGAVLYFNPENYNEMAAVMEQGLNSFDAHRVAGVLQRYSGEKFARETLSVYRVFA